MYSKKEIEFFLRFGYFPNYKPKFEPSKVDKLDLDGKSYDELKSEFFNIFLSVIKKNINDIPMDKLIIIPISGGLDSRAILAAVIEMIPLSRIRTYTFGIKGSYDFEIGKIVANEAGVHHDAIELNELSYKNEEMLEVARRCDYQTHLFHHPPLDILDKLVGDNVVISGYLGDLIFGSYADIEFDENNTVDKWYFKKGAYSEYFNIDDNIQLSELFVALDDESIVPKHEQRILYERGPNLTAPHILMNGSSYKVPLIDKTILDFMYSVPNEFRVNESLFIDTMIEYYPKLFNIKAKTTFGYHLKSPKIVTLFERMKNKVILILNEIGIDIVYPPYNYIDFNKGINTRSDLNQIFEKNLQDIEYRNILGSIKPMEILKKHRKNGKMHQELILLVSLELIIKSREKFENL